MRAPFVILSAYRPNYTAEANEERHASALAHLERYGAIAAMGCYKGTREQSIIVPFQVAVDVPYDMAMRVARRYGQESVLRVERDARAYLVYDPSRTEREEFLGTWTEYDAPQARTYGAWTELAGQFFVVI